MDDLDIPILDLARAVFSVYLDERELDILLRRAQGETLQSIATASGGITRERVRQIENIAVTKLPENALELFTEIREARPIPRTYSSRATSGLRRRERKALEGYLNAHPDGPFDYQTIYRELGLPPKTDQPLSGTEALDQMRAEYGQRFTTRIGQPPYTYIWCQICHHFLPADLFNPGTRRGALNRICNPCNRDRKYQWWLTHKEHISEYVRKRRLNPDVKKQDYIIQKRHQFRKRMGLSKPRPQRAASAASEPNAPHSRGRSGKESLDAADGEF